MSNAPYLLPKARAGYRMGHGEILDHMFYDGLQSPWDGKLMGCFADATAEKYGFTRARAGCVCHRIGAARACTRCEAGEFDAEVAAGDRSRRRKGVTTVARDETPLHLRRLPHPAAQAGLRPAGHGHRRLVFFDLRRRRRAGARVATRARASVGREPVARLVAWASSALAPEWFTIAPVAAIAKVLTAAGWSAGDVDLFEVNEAFAVVAMAAKHDLTIDHATAERQRRRLRARPPDRRHRRAHHHHADPCAAEARRPARRRRAVHRRRRGHGRGACETGTSRRIMKIAQSRRHHRRCLGPRPCRGAPLHRAGRRGRPARRAGRSAARRPCRNWASARTTSVATSPPKRRSMPRWPRRPRPWAGSTCW